MRTTGHPLCALFVCSACTLTSSSAKETLINDFDGNATDAETSTPRVIHCSTTDAAAQLVKVRITPTADAFEISAQTTAGRLFDVTDQRPSLNMRVPDAPTDVPSEFVDFRPSGLDALPVFGTTRLELDLSGDAKTLVYANASTLVQLQCAVSAPKLLAYLGIAPTWPRDVADAKSVGFDIDDTLLFATPTFARGFATGGTPAPTDVVFWTQVNRCDRGCPAELLTLPDGTTKMLPASEPCRVKARAAELVAYHKAHGAEVYAITGRPDIHGEPMRAYIEQVLGIAADHVFFEPDLDRPGNPAGKSDRMEQLGLDVFYGDADSDVTDARRAHIRSVRFLRSPRSSYRKDGRFTKYHPGYYGETILAASYD